MALPEADYPVHAFLNAQGLPSQLNVKFYVDAMPDDQATNGWVESRIDPQTGGIHQIRHPGAGRPVYREAEHIEIQVPGDIKEVRRRPVRPGDIDRFPREYAAFKAGLADPQTGTPLAMLPFITKAQVLEFQAAGIKTAENLRDCSDANGQKFPAFQQIRQRVVDFLKAAEGAAPMLQLRGELEQRDSEINQLKAQLAELAHKVSQKKDK